MRDCSILKIKTSNLVKNDFFLAIIFGTVSLLLRLTLCYPKFETSDDFIVGSVLSGAYSSMEDPHMFFSNILLGYPLAFLYKAFPGIGWFFIFMEFLGWLSLIACFHTILKKVNSNLRYVLCLSLSVFFLDDIFVSVQFTKIASFAIISGSIIFVDSLFDNRHRDPAGMAGGAFLLITGSLLRFSCLYIAGPFVAIYLIRVIYNTFDKTKIKSIMINGVLGVGLIGILLLLNAVNSMIWNSEPDYKYFSKYSQLRSSITDNRRSDNDSVISEYNELGLDYIDYDMLNSWGFRDRDIYSSELLTSITELDSGSNVDFQTISDLLISRAYFVYPSFMGLLVFFVVGMFSRKNRCYSLTVFMTALFMLVLFAIMGRVVYRVEYSIFLCATVCSISTNINIEIKAKHKRLFEIVGITFISIALFYRLLFYIPDFSYSTMTDDEYISYQTSSLYNAEDYLPNRCRINVYDRRSLSSFIDHIENDHDNYYMLDFLSCIQRLYINYKPWLSLDKGYFKDNYLFLSGCDMNFPGEICALENNGIDSNNPYKSLINDNVYLVDNYLYELKLAYLRKYWYPTVKVKLVNEIDGYKIWKFYIPEKS